MNHGFGGSCRHLLGLLLLMTPGLTLLTGQALPTHAVHAAGASIQLSPTSGPPTTQITVTGIGFGPQETVIITFAGSQAAIAITTTSKTTGRLTTTITVPAAASPGTHMVQAIDQKRGLSAQAPFQVQTTWPMFGFDPQHSNLNPYEHVLSPTNVSRLTSEWSTHFGSAGQLVVSSPAVANGMIYIDDSERYLDAFDAATGALAWRHAIGNIHGLSSPAVADGLVYVGTNSSSTLYALNARTGVLVWSYSQQGLSFGTPTIADGILYTEEHDGILYAFNAHNGTLLWTAAGGGAITITSAPAISNGVVYAVVTTTFDSSLRVEAINAYTGAMLWQSAGIWPISNTHFTDFYASPSVVKNLVYILGTDDQAGGGERLYAFNAQTGTVVWSARLDADSLSFPPAASPAVANGVVYIGAQTGRLFAFDAQTGTPRWSFAAAASGLIASAPAVANGVVYIGSISYGPSRPAQVGHLSALDAQTGRPLWHYDRRNPPGWPNGTFSVVVVNGTVYACSYVGTSENQLAAFHLPSMPAREQTAR